MEIVFVRHAEPQRRVSAAERGDPGLSVVGEDQARLVADRLGFESWDAIYSSPQRRAFETAEAVAERLGLATQIDERLAEFDYEKGVYIHLEDLLRPGNEQMEAFRREDFSAYGTDAATIRRTAVSGVNDIVAAHAGQRVVVVTHGTVVNAFVGSFLGVPRLVFHHPAYTGITRVLASRSGHRELSSLNESTHLRMAKDRCAATIEES